MREAALDKEHRFLAIGAVAWVVALLAGAGMGIAQPSPVCVQPPVGMVGWWPGDGSTADLIGGNPGTWHGTVAYTAGEVGQAFSLGGSSYVDVPSSPALSPTAAITIDAWVNTSQSNATGRIVDKITVAGTDGYLLDLLGGQLRLIVDGHSVLGGSTLQSGVTYHVAGTFDGSTLTVYVDGVSDGTYSWSGTIPTNSLPVRIGADSTGVANRFVGWIDEVEIFSRGLSQAEIQGIHNAFSAGKCKVQPIPALSPLGVAVLALLVAAAAAVLLSR